MDKIKGRCSVCDKETRVRHLAIYAFGSEGIWACEMCDKLIAHVIGQIASSLKTRITWAKYKNK